MKRNQKKSKTETEIKVNSKKNDSNSDDIMDASSSPCAVCEEIIPGDGIGIFCQGFCRAWYHPGCVNIDEEAYDSIGKMPEYVKWYCKECSNQISRLVSDVYDIENYISLHASITELTKLVKGITNYSSENSSRIDKIETILTTRANSQQTTTSRPQSKKQVIHAGKARTVAESGPTGLHGNHSCLEKEDKKTPFEAASNNKNPPYNQFCDDELFVLSNDGKQERVYVTESKNGNVGNYNSEFANNAKFNSVEEYAQEDSREQWKVFRSKNQRTKSSPPVSKQKTVGSAPGWLRPKARGNRTIYGKAKTNDGLEVADRISWLFISRLKSSVEAETVKHHAISICGEGSVIHCEKLITKYNSYASFKVGCSFDNIDKLLNGDAWPVGVILCKYTPAKLNRARSRPVTEYISEVGPSEVVSNGTTSVSNLNLGQQKN